MARDTEFLEDRERQIPADVRRAAPDVGKASDLAALARAPLGEPLIDYNVRSIYDSRPVNGYDFNVIETADINSSMSNPSIYLTFEVPSGYIGVLRKIEFWTNGLPNVSRQSVTLSPVANSQIQRFNTAAVGNATGQGAPVECFVIADERQQLGARIDWGASPASISLYVQLYGNFLLKTGRAAPFEIANQAGGVSATGKRGIR